jgi:membrane protease YdiL (CAAX protease family)
MPVEPARSDRDRAATTSKRALEALCAACGMALFALFAHRRDALLFASIAGLALAAWMVHRALADVPATSLFALSFSRRVAWPCAVAALLGIALALAYRAHLGVSLVPVAWTPFAFTAALIGTVEELLYRGYVATSLRPYGILAAVVAPALLHTTYKCALFGLAPGTPGTIDVPLLALATFVVGIGLGSLRAWGRSVAPPIVLHALFDVLVYGDAQRAPWWVWS